MKRAKNVKLNFREIKSGFKIVKNQIRLKFQKQFLTISVVTDKIVETLSALWRHKFNRPKC